MRDWWLLVRLLRSVSRVYLPGGNKGIRYVRGVAAAGGGTGAAAAVVVCRAGGTGTMATPAPLEAGAAGAAEAAGHMVTMIVWVTVEGAA